MMLWVVLALMTAAAVVSVLWPLVRRKPMRSGSDIVVYRDQLDEIDRDRAAGLIGEREAEAARVEVSRRLLAAAEDAKPALPGGSGVWRRRALALAAIVLLPASAFAVYLTLGSPNLPAQPLASRLDTPPEHRSLVEMVSRVEAYLERNPNDGHGWEVLGPVYMRIGRYEDAARARKNALRILGPTAEREADVGEALTGVANGVVTAEAKAAFERALALNPNDYRSRFFMGLAAEQDGRPKDAAEIWRNLLASAPKDASWTDFVANSLARVDPSVKARRAPTPEEAAAADQQAAMIRGMVARLEERLKEDGSDVEGWLRLIRSYAVLGDRDKLQAAANNARKALAGDPEKLRRVDEMVASSTRFDTGDPRDASSDQSASLTPEQQAEMARGMVERLAKRLERDRTDVEGWLLLVRSYTVLGDKDKATAAAAEARQALAGEPAKLQQFEEIGKTIGLPVAGAPAETAAAPPQAPPQPGPTAEDMAAAGRMTPEQRSEMIQGMVQRLADRLKQDGSDVEGWLRLVRAYMVLGQKDKATAAAADARRALANDPDKLRRIDEMAKGFGLSG